MKAEVDTYSTRYIYLSAYGHVFGYLELLSYYCFHRPNGIIIVVIVACVGVCFGNLTKPNEDTAGLISHCITIILVLEIARSRTSFYRKDESGKEACVDASVITKSPKSWHRVIGPYKGEKRPIGVAGVEGHRLTRRDISMPHQISQGAGKYAADPVDHGFVPACPIRPYREL